MEKIKEKYEVLKKKHNLPSYEDMNKDFDIEEISEDSTLVLQKIRASMHDKIDFYAKMIEAILQPESSLSGLYEAHYVDDDEKNSAYSLFKKLMGIVRYSNLVAVTNTDMDNAKFIKDTIKEWNSLKGDIQKHVKRLISLWDKETDIREDLNYFG